MARENPTWGRRRIQAELALLGYAVAELTVAKYMHRTSPRPSPTWRVFLATHARDIGAVDFFLVPTLTYRLLCAFTHTGSGRAGFEMTSSMDGLVAYYFRIDKEFKWRVFGGLSG
jgi:hypothetical protein